MAQTLQTLSIISFVFAGICLVLAIFFWFFFKIPTVMGDLSGRTARKSIAKMRAANEKTGAKAYKESKINAERGKVTGSIPDSNELKKKDTAINDGKVETGLLAENKAENVEFEATGMLDEETGFLESETTGLLIDENAMAPLDAPTSQRPVRTGGKKLELIEEIMFIHTDEVI